MRFTVKNNSFTYLQRITLLLLFLAGLNVGNRYFYFCFVATSIFIVLRKKIVIDNQVIALMILSISWVLFSPDSDNLSLTAFVKPFLYPMAYVVGRNFFIGSVQSNYEQKQKLMIPTFVIISVGPFLHYLMNYLNNMSSLNRNTVDIWTGTVLSATNQAALACMMLGIALGFMFVPTKPLKKVMCIIAVTVILLYNLILSGRTLLIMAAIIITVCIVYYFFENRKFDRRFKILAIILLAIIITYFAIIYNIFGITDYLKNSNIYLRFAYKDNTEIFSTLRNQLKLRYLENLELSVLGGCHIKNVVMKYAHDLFLDTYDEAGVFACMAVIFFVCRSIYIMLKCIKNKKIDFSIRVLMLAFYISVMCVFLVEPILQGVPWLFISYCFIHGVVENYYKSLIAKKERYIMGAYNF